MSGSSNVGALDATVRILAGIPVVFVGPWSAVTLAPDWAAVTLPVSFMIGAVLIMTGTFRWDPAYSMMGVSTARAK